MAYIGPVRRWDVFRADLGAAGGQEQKGASRSVIVVSNDGFNATFRMATVIPMTRLSGKRRRVYPFEVQLPAGVVKGGDASIVMPHQIRSISTSRLLDRIGAVHDTWHRIEIENRMLEHLGIEFEAEGIE